MLPEDSFKRSIEAVVTHPVGRRLKVQRQPFDDGQENANQPRHRQEEINEDFLMKDPQ